VCRFLTALLIGLAVIGGAVLLVVPPIAQPQWYHDFADKRAALGIVNIANVTSNIVFLVVGGWGIAHLFSARWKDGIADSATRSMYFVFFVAVALTAVGSAYYHLRPDNERLVWDRLPIAISLMALFGAVLTEYVSRRAGILMFIPLLLAGACAVFYWHLSEQWGRGDLRFYLLTQLYPVVAIPAILWFSPPTYTKAENVYAAIAWYGSARLCEFLDSEIYALGRIVSGHTLKHIGAAVSCYMILSWIHRRRPTDLGVGRTGHGNCEQKGSGILGRGFPTLS
jgi:hypothetical protein